MPRLLLALLLLAGPSALAQPASPAGALLDAGSTPGASAADGAAGPSGSARRSTLVAFALDAGVLATSGLAANALITAPCTTEPCNGEEAGFTVLYAGMAAGMTAGHLYAGDTRRALIGLGIRAAGMGFIVWGNAQNDGDFTIDEPGYLIGLPLLLAGTAYSLVTTPRSVREFNARPALVLRPAQGPGGAPGLALTARL